MATNLFAMPGTVGGAAGAGGAQKPLVEFRAGKMNFDETTKKVTSDKRKGLVQLTQSGADGLIHFSWKDRTSGVVENDLIVFPDEAVFKHVKQCATGRVYLLEYKTSSRKLFFWMQEPSDAKDEENATKINQYMNNPPHLVTIQVVLPVEWGAWIKMLCFKCLLGGAVLNVVLELLLDNNLSKGLPYWE